MADAVSRINKPDIQLSNGLYYDFYNPDPDVVTIEVIAHALANICRYTGHVSRFYSVAEHSVRASYLGPDNEALERLMHDAGEALVGDVSTPLKRQLGGYAEIEERAEILCATKFGYQYPYPPSVKQADLIMLATEKKFLLPQTEVQWEVLKGIEPMVGDLRNAAGTPSHWKQKFIDRYEELKRV